MTTLEPPPLRTPIEVKDDKDVVIGKSVLGSIIAWAKWLNRLYAAASRTVVAEDITFPLTADGTYSSHLITLTPGTVTFGDTITLTAPIPPNGTCFTVVTQFDDQILIMFNNYSGAPQQFILPQQFTVTIWRN